MNGLARTGWVLTREAFDKLLACLDADSSQRAGEKYETIRRMLVKFFNWRGATFPEELADETLNRVTKKLDEGDEIRDLVSYSYGVARLVFLETVKAPESKRISLEEASGIAVRADDPAWRDEGDQYECFESCLESVTFEGRRVILQYYQDERRARIDRRKKLAEALGIPLNALRSRAQRMRDKLERCVEECLKKKTGGPT